MRLLKIIQPFWKRLSGNRNWSAEDQRLLQAGRVHLAIHYGDAEKALAAAQALKDMQSDARGQSDDGSFNQGYRGCQENCSR